MRLGLISQSICSIAAAVALANGGCSGTNSANIQGNNTPHALAAIVVGEEHESGGSESTALISASFFPNAANIPNCTTTVSGCTIAKPPVCDGVTGPQCTEEQLCTFDSTSCTPTCETACTATCPQGQECYFASANTQSCRAIQSFDGGDLVFSGPGLASGFTLFPPDYTFSGTQGNPLVPGGTIQINSNGAASAGFAPFQETFTATSLIQTVPSLKTLTSANVYNPAGFALGWQPGGDTVTITLVGPSDITAQCTASDSAGTFTVPAAVISAIAGPGNPGMTVSVTRARLQVQTNGKTVGTYAGTTVPPVGFFDLTASSTETYEIAGCPVAGEAMCGGTCIDVTSSPTNCGTCGHVCASGDVCADGVCTAESGGCTAPLTSCNGLCVELSSSATNCGACGHVCPSGDACVDDECTASSTCPSGYTLCSDGCQYLLSSSTDCGGCGISCNGGTCSDGECATTCPTDYTQCSDGCQYLLSSSTDCGSCGNSCNGGECADGECVSSALCGTGETECSDGCADLQTSNTDCGTCGNACSGTTCSNGVCGTSTETCSTCESSAESGTCATQANSCAEDTECSDYTTCVSNCAGSSTCETTCQTDYATGASEAESLWSCICSTACSSECATSTYCTTTP